MTDLQVQYKDKKSAIYYEIDELKKHLSKHAKNQKANCNDWGYVDDLVRVNRLLRATLEAI